MKTATLSGRKRTKDLSQNVQTKPESLDPVVSKHEQLNKLKDDSLLENYNGVKDLNLKIKIAAIVRSYKANAQAGTRLALKYTRDKQRKMLMDKIRSAIDEYSDYGQKSGWSRADNHVKCQHYADQIYHALSAANAPISKLVVSDPEV
jgi:hypothetical protein